MADVWVKGTKDAASRRAGKQSERGPYHQKEKGQYFRAEEHVYSVSQMGSCGEGLCCQQLTHSLKKLTNEAT